MKTRKYKLKKGNKTKKICDRRNSIDKNSIPTHKVKKLHINYKLYASKSYDGSEILKYNREQERIHNDSCVIENMSWFGKLDVAKNYKTKETNLYLWKTKRNVKLLDIDLKNHAFIDYIFTNTKTKLIPSIKITKKINYEHEYLKMNDNQKALYEFKFAFGFLTLAEQNTFLEFIRYLIEHNIFDIKRRNQESILNKLKIKIRYYTLGKYFMSKNKMNRLSFYSIDKHAVMNLCKCVHDLGLDISGIYQKNTSSFWFPDLYVYKMNIEEYILFNPHRELRYIRQEDL